MSVIFHWLGGVCLAWLLVGCGGSGGDDTVPIAARAGAADIGPAGGMVDAVLEGGTTVTLTVPAGALSATTSFRIDPSAAASGTLGGFTLLPASVVPRKPLGLSITLPAGPAPDPDTSLVFSIGTHQLPMGAAVDRNTRTIAVDLDAAFFQASVATPLAVHGRKNALSVGTPTTSDLFFLQSLSLNSRMNVLDKELAELAANGSSDQAEWVRVVMEAILTDPAGASQPRVHAEVPTWTGVVCAQQLSAVNALNGFTGTGVQAFTDLAKEVFTWDQRALELNAIVATLVPQEAGCPGVDSDFTAPVQAKLPSFLANVRLALDLLDPNVADDFNQLFKVRFRELLDLAADFAGRNLVDSQNAVRNALTAELERVRAVAYANCRSQRNQLLQAQMITAILVDPNINTLAAQGWDQLLLSDVQFCGMPIHWEVLDAQGSLLQQGSAGGIGPGVIVTSVPVPLAGAATLRLTGPLAALICPIGSQNNEQLGFSAGPAAGPLSSIGVLTSSNAFGYLEASPQDFDLAALSAQGVDQIRVARQGGLCNGDFQGLNGHVTLAAFALDFGPIQITTVSLRAGVVGQPYSQALAAHGGRSPDVWAATGLPSGLSLDPNTGVISGTPALSGTATVSLTVTSSDGQTAQRTLALNVTSTASGPLLIVASELPAAVQGQGYSVTLAATGGTAPLTWSASGLPAGLTIDGSSGVISGTAADTGSLSLTISVASADGQSRQATLPLATVRDVGGTYAGDVKRDIDQGFGFAATRHVERMTAVVVQRGDVLDINVTSSLTSAAETTGKTAILNDSAHSFHMTARLLPTDKVSQLSFDNPSLACPGVLGLDSTVSRFGPAPIGAGGSVVPAFFVRFGESDCHALAGGFRELLDGVLGK